jgi:hypothetical protein
MSAQPLVGVAFVAAGAWLLLRWGAANRRSRLTQAWRSAPGTIVGCDVRRGESRRPVSWIPHVEYRYVAAGREWTGAGIMAGATSATSRRSRAEELCRKYSPGRSVHVFYDPADPSKACLERRHQRGAFQLLAGLFALLGGAILLGL